MSIPQFTHLTTEEVELLYHAPAIITALIGGADGNLDENEIEEALKLIAIRKETGELLLLDYYEKVNEVLDEAIAKYSVQNIEELSTLLSSLNTSLDTIDPLYANTLVSSWRSFAKEIAEASGGIAGLMSISHEEKQLIDLPMLTIN